MRHSPNSKALSVFVHYASLRLKPAAMQASPKVQQLTGMREIREIFCQYLGQDAEMSRSLWGISTREALFQHINGSPRRFTAAYTYSVRVDGVLKSLDGLVDLVRRTDHKAQSEFPAWPAMIWGSSAWGFSVSVVIQPSV